MTFFKDKKFEKQYDNFIKRGNLTDGPFSKTEDKIIIEERKNDHVIRRQRTLVCTKYQVGGADNMKPTNFENSFPKKVSKIENDGFANTKSVPRDHSVTKRNEKEQSRMERVSLDSNKTWHEHFSKSTASVQDNKNFSQDAYKDSTLPKTKEQLRNSYNRFSISQDKRESLRNDSGEQRRSNSPLPKEIPKGSNDQTIGKKVGSSFSSRPKENLKNCHCELSGSSEPRESLKNGNRRSSISGESNGNYARATKKNRRSRISSGRRENSEIGKYRDSYSPEPRESLKNGNRRSSNSKYPRENMIDSNRKYSSLAEPKKNSRRSNNQTIKKTRRSSMSSENLKKGNNRYSSSPEQGKNLEKTNRRSHQRYSSLDEPKKISRRSNGQIVKKWRRPSISPENLNKDSYRHSSSPEPRRNLRKDTRGSSFFEDPRTNMKKSSHRHSSSGEPKKISRRSSKKHIKKSHSPSISSENLKRNRYSSSLEPKKNLRKDTRKSSVFEDSRESMRKNSPDTPKTISRRSNVKIIPKTRESSISSEGGVFNSRSSDRRNIQNNRKWTSSVPKGNLKNIQHRRSSSRESKEILKGSRPSSVSSGPRESRRNENLRNSRSSVEKLIRSSNEIVAKNRKSSISIEPKRRLSRGSLSKLKEKSAKVNKHKSPKTLESRESLRNSSRKISSSPELRKISEKDKEQLVKKKRRASISSESRRMSRHGSRESVKGSRNSTRQSTTKTGNQKGFENYFDPCRKAKLPEIKKQTNERNKNNTKIRSRTPSINKSDSRSETAAHIGNSTTQVKKPQLQTKSGKERTSSTQTPENFIQDSMATEIMKRKSFEISNQDDFQEDRVYDKEEQGKRASLQSRSDEKRQCENLRNNACTCSKDAVLELNSLGKDDNCKSYSKVWSCSGTSKSGRNFVTTSKESRQWLLANLRQESEGKAYDLICDQILNQLQSKESNKCSQQATLQENNMEQKLHLCSEKIRCEENCIKKEVEKWIKGVECRTESLKSWKHYETETESIVEPTKLRNKRDIGQESNQERHSHNSTEKPLMKNMAEVRSSRKLTSMELISRKSDNTQEELEGNLSVKCSSLKPAEKIKDNLKRTSFVPIHRQNLDGINISQCEDSKQSLKIIFQNPLQTDIVRREQDNCNNLQTGANQKSVPNYLKTTYKHDKDVQPNKNTETANFYRQTSSDWISDECLIDRSHQVQSAEIFENPDTLDCSDISPTMKSLQNSIVEYKGCPCMLPKYTMLLNLLDYEPTC